MLPPSGSRIALEAPVRPLGAFSMPEGRTATRVPAQKLLGGHRRPWRRLIAASGEVEEPSTHACIHAYM